jgi:hypothetical protein
MLCRQCGGPDDAPDHDLFCDGQQGRIEALYVPPLDPDSDAFEGVPPADLEAITGAITLGMVESLVAVLEPDPKRVDDVRRGLLACAWFPCQKKRDTQLRKIRVLRDAAIAFGYPVRTTNFGYFLGDADALIASAHRARRYAAGALHRAALMERLAAMMAKLA